MITKEQRVFKNNGKRFEEDIKNSFSNNVFTYRPPDTGGGMMARFTQESLCDLMVYNTESKNFILMELKSTLGTSVSFRPYKQCMEYERVKKEFDDWNSKQTSSTRKPIKNEINDYKKYIKSLYKSTNQAMIKYHQIKNLLNVKEKFGIETYILFTFFKTNNTYAIKVDSFANNFWKLTSKKSINEKDLTNLIEGNLAFKVNQEFIGKSMKSKYEIDFLCQV